MYTPFISYQSLIRQLLPMVTFLAVGFTIGALFSCETDRKRGRHPDSDTRTDNTSEAQNLLITFYGMREGVPDLVEVWIDNEFVGCGYVSRMHIDIFNKAPKAFRELLEESSFAVSIPIANYSEHQRVEIRCDRFRNRRISFSMESLKVSKCERIMVIQPADSSGAWSGTAVFKGNPRDYVWGEGVELPIPITIEY